MLLPLRLNLQAQPVTHQKWMDDDERLKKQLREDEDILAVIMTFLEIKNCR